MDVRRIAGFLVPPRCPVCARPSDPSALLCGTCMRELNHCRVLRDDPPEGVDRIVSCAGHDGVPRALLAAYKFRHLTGLSGLISGFMADAAGPVAGTTLMVPVPPAMLRNRIRGFDPVRCLAGEVADLTGVGLPPEPVLARRGSRRQRGRGRAGRLADPPAIRPLEGPARILDGREVLLLDDVMTTGATLASAAAALRLAGACTITALTFTRRL